MKTKKFTLKIAILVVLAFHLSCQKKNRNNATEVVQQNNLGDVAFLDFAYMAEQVAQGPLYFTTFNADCSKLLYDTLGTSITATIDYGIEDCMCKDGKTRSGKIRITYPINNTAVGAITTVVPDSYKVNGTTLVGSRTATVKTNVLTEEICTATMTVGDKLDPISWKANWMRKFIDNPNGPNVIAGRNYELTGETTGKTTRGDDFTVSITDALIVQAGCRYIKEGKTTITSSNFKKEAILDYGKGDCDNKATLTYRKKDIELRL